MRHFSESGQRGAAAVEFAIILPLLILLIFGAIEFSLMLFNKQVITNAAREGARRAIINKVPQITDAEIIQYIRDNFENQLITFGNDSTALEDPVVVREGTPEYVTVTVRYKYDFLVLSNLGFDPITLVSSATMTMENT